MLCFRFRVSHASGSIAALCRFFVFFSLVAEYGRNRHHEDFWYVPYCRFPWRNYKVSKYIKSNRAKLIDYRHLQNEGLFCEKHICPHGTEMSLRYFPRDGLMWECQSRICLCSRSRTPLPQDLFFAGQTFPVNDVLLILYFCIVGADPAFIERITHFPRSLILKVVQDYYILLECGLRREGHRIGERALLRGNLALIAKVKC